MQNSKEQLPELIEYLLLIICNQFKWKDCIWVQYINCVHIFMNWKYLLWFCSQDKFIVDFFIDWTMFLDITPVIRTFEIFIMIISTMSWNFDALKPISIAYDLLYSKDLLLNPIVQEKPSPRLPDSPVVEKPKFSTAGKYGFYSRLRTKILRIVLGRLKRKVIPYPMPLSGKLMVSGFTSTYSDLFKVTRTRVEVWIKCHPNQDNSRIRRRKQKWLKGKVIIVRSIKFSRRRIKYRLNKLVP